MPGELMSTPNYKPFRRRKSKVQNRYNPFGQLSNKKQAKKKLVACSGASGSRPCDERKLDATLGNTKIDLSISIPKASVDHRPTEIDYSRNDQAFALSRYCGNHKCSRFSLLEEPCEIMRMGYCDGSTIYVKFEKEKKRILVSTARKLYNLEPGHRLTEGVNEILREEGYLF